MILIEDAVVGRYGAAKMFSLVPFAGDGGSHRSVAAAFSHRDVEASSTSPSSALVPGRVSKVFVVNVWSGGAPMWIGERRLCSPVVTRRGGDAMVRAVCAATAFLFCY
ncbi:Uncharacterized protein Rs2_51840 [Raphanus sativus]|nr:Uncharacterized protein Rs2_51840 [Raphanus sativus]